MIFLNEINKAPSTSVLYIPYILLNTDKEDFVVIDGGFSNNEQALQINGGFASTKATEIINGGRAKFDGSVVLDVKLTHTISNEKFECTVLPLDVNDTYFKVSFVFNVIPPQGQYEIKVIEENNYIYKGILQIGEINKNNNRIYNKIIKYNVYE